MSKSNIAAKATEIGILTSVLVRNAYAAVPTDLQRGVDAAQPSGASRTLFGSGSIFQSIANTLIFIVGAVAVLMLIIGGLRYVLSSGNASSVEGAKNTILYAIIGLIVAILAFALVNFVIDRVGATTN